LGCCNKKPGHARFFIFSEKAAPRYSIPFAISSTTFFASPNTIIVLSI
jgi:hypothetical protein